MTLMYIWHPGQLFWSMVSVNFQLTWLTLFYVSYNTHMLVGHWHGTDAWSIGYWSNTMEAHPKTHHDHVEWFSFPLISLTYQTDINQAGSSWIFRGTCHCHPVALISLGGSCVQTLRRAVEGTGRDGFLDAPAEPGGAGDQWLWSDQRSGCLGYQYIPYVNIPYMNNGEP